jgi:cell division protein ZapA (FtsZ GTPase activity inhibitor)
MTEPITTVEAAVAELGALPMPAGNPTQALSDERLAEIREHVAETKNWSLGNLAARDLLAEVQRLNEQVERLKDDRVRLLDQQAKDDDEYVQATAQRDRYRLAWTSARERAQAYGEGILRVVKDRESYQGWLKQEQAATQQLKARIAELESATATEFGIRFSDSTTLRSGNPLDRSEQERRLADYLPECPQARLVQRTVRYGDWTEADR